MPRIETDTQLTKIYLDTREDLDVSQVYNHAFFKSMGIAVSIDAPRYRGMAVQSLSNEPTVPDTPEQKNIPIPIEFNEDADIVDVLFGPEKVPNGYTDLPLDLSKPGVPSTNAPHQSKSFLVRMQEYISSFVKPSPLPIVPGEPIIITIPHKKQSDKIQTLNQWRIQYLQSPYSIFCIKDTNISYEMMDTLLNDLLFQMEYFYDQGFTFRELKMEHVYVIEGRFVILASDTMVPNTDKNTSYRALAIDIIYQFAGRGIELLEEIKDTFLYGQLLQK